jgi:hypothetical protein
VVESDWIDNYYNPLEIRIAKMRERIRGGPAASFLDTTQEEIDIFRRFSSEYGYVFCVMQNIP